MVGSTTDPFTGEGGFQGDHMKDKRLPLGTIAFRTVIAVAAAAPFALPLAVATASCIVLVAVALIREDV